MERYAAFLPVTGATPNVSLGERSNQELYNLAQDVDISGRSKMNKSELVKLYPHLKEPPPEMVHNALADAEFQEMQALTDYNTAIANYYRAFGWRTGAPGLRSGVTFTLRGSGRGVSSFLPNNASLLNNRFSIL